MSIDDLMSKLEEAMTPNTHSSLAAIKVNIAHMDRGREIWHEIEGEIEGVGTGLLEEMIEADGEDKIISLEEIEATMSQAAVDGLKNMINGMDRQDLIDGIRYLQSVGPVVDVIGHLLSKKLMSVVLLDD